MSEKCIRCGKELSTLDMNFYRKMVNRGAKEFMCIPCLAEYFGMTVEKCHEKIEHFRQQGCTLFL